MSRDNIPKTSLKKLEQFFTKTLGNNLESDLTLGNFMILLFIDTNNDGLVNWTDFEAAIEVC